MDRFQSASSTIMPMFVTILLLGAMTVLSVLGNQSWKLILEMVALFTTFFAFTLELLTNARREEVPGATAASMAVLVVYVVSPGLDPSNKI
jgi:hypothetical protein